MPGLMVTLLLAVCLFGKGYGYDEELKCPNKFIIDQVNTVMIEANSTVIDNANCAVPPKFVALTIKRVGAVTVSRICSTEYSCPSPGPVGEPTPEKATCGCIRSQNNIRSFEFKLYVSKSKDSGGNFSFNLCNRPLGQVHRTIMSSCTKIHVGVEESTSTPSVPHPDTENHDCGTWCIVGIVGGLIAIIAIGVGVILFLRSRGFRGMPLGGSV